MSGTDGLDAATPESSITYMLEQGLITRTKTGQLRLRSRGKRLMALLVVIDQLGDRAGEVIEPGASRKESKTA